MIGIKKMRIVAAAMMVAAAPLTAGASSLTRHAQSTCTGQDQVFLNDGALPVIYPWMPYPIEITQVALTITQAPPDGFLYVFSGNSYDGDVMAELAGHMSAVNITLATPFEFPAAGTPGSPHLDLHVACTDLNAPYQIDYTIYYRIDGAS